MRLLIRVLVLLAVAYVPAPSLRSQGVDGRITGRVTGPGATPLAEVSVTVVGTGISGITGVDGAFALERVPVGSYKVRFESLTHRPAEVHQVRVAGDATARLDVTLEPGTLQDQPSVRTAGPVADPADPAARYTLPPELVAELPADRLRDLLAALPGVAEWYAAPGPLVRGTRPGEWVALVNGIPVRSTRTGTFPLRPGLTTLAEVSLVPAPGTEFGDAHGGLVNLVTRSGGDALRGSFRYTTDEPLGSGVSLGFNRFEASLGGPIGGPVRFYLGGTLQGQLGAARGEGVVDVPAYVMAGIDTTVIFDPGGSAVPVSIPRFAQFNGDCDRAANFDVACQGRRLPLETATFGSAVGRLDVSYGRGAVALTTILDMAQSRGWPGTLSFDPEGYQGTRTTASVYGLTWTHQLLREAGRRLAVTATVSYQTESRTAGTLDPDWERNHRSPRFGVTLSPMTFLVDRDHFSSDTGPYAVTILGSEADWVRLVENFVYDRGTRVPYLDRFELAARSDPRVNPWGAVMPFPTQGADPGYANTHLAAERRRLARLALDWRSSSMHRLHAGTEVQSADVRSFTGQLTRASGADAFSGDPSRLAVFATNRIETGPVTLDLGLRWERFDVGSRFPVVPGRIFTHPALDPADPSSIDSVFAASESHAVFLPSIAAGFRLGASTGLRLSFARMARMPDLARVLSRTNVDLARTSPLEAFGRDVDWPKSATLEAGIGQRVSRVARLDLAVYRKQHLSGLARRIAPFSDPFTGGIINANVLTNDDTLTVYGLELVAQLQGTPWLGGQVSYTYQDAGDGSVRADVREHTLAGFLVFAAPQGAGAGRWHGAVIDGLVAITRFRLASGLPYTLLMNQGVGTLVPRASFGNIVQPAVPSRLPWIKQLDLRVVKGFHLGPTRWSAFADIRNLLGAENVLMVFAETGGTENELHRELFTSQEYLHLGLDAQASGAWTQVSKDGRTVSAADLGGDCGAWVGSGGEPACVALRRAESRWGDGDGVYDLEEFGTALAALYELLYGRWTMLGPARQVRFGVEVRF